MRTEPDQQAFVSTSNICNLFFRGHKISSAKANMILSQTSRRLATVGGRILSKPKQFNFLGGIFADSKLKFLSTLADDDAFLSDPSLIKLKFKERLQEEREKAVLGGGQQRIDRQHAKGSLTARERIALLFDEGTFQEMDQLKAHRCTEFGMDEVNFPGDGIITGHGLVNGRHVYAFSQGMFQWILDS